MAGVIALTVLMIGSVALPESRCRADDLDVLARTEIRADGVLQVYADESFMSLSAQDREAVARSMWTVLYAKSSRLRRIEFVSRFGTKAPLFTYDATGGLTATSASVQQ